MVFVFQGETGGALSFPIASTIPAASGYIDVVDIERIYYRFDGTIASSVLSVSKSGVSNLVPGQYIVLPQVIDSSNRIYFLDQIDLQIIEVPDFFSSAVLTSGNSILIQLEQMQAAIDALSASDKTYRHVQSSAAAVWTILHNLNKYVSVMARDSAGDLVVGQVEWLSLSTVRLTFSAAFSGEAYCN